MIGSQGAFIYRAVMTKEQLVQGHSARKSAMQGNSPGPAFVPRPPRTPVITASSVTWTQVSSFTYGNNKRIFFFLLNTSWSQERRASNFALDTNACFGLWSVCSVCALWIARHFNYYCLLLWSWFNCWFAAPWLRGGHFIKQVLFSYCHF